MLAIGHVLFWTLFLVAVSESAEVVGGLQVDLPLLPGPVVARRLAAEELERKISPASVDGGLILKNEVV